MIENFTEEEADTAVHRIYGQSATLSINYKPRDWDSVRAWILKVGSGWHQAETAGPWLGEEYEEAWETYYEVQGYSPFATCGNDQCRSKDLCVLTSAALPSTSPSSPLHAPFTRSAPGPQVPGVN